MSKPKPQAILDLERRLDIDIPDFTGKQPDFGDDVFFQTNTEGLVSTLSLRGCGLKEMDWIKEFPHLISLNLSGNQITVINGLDNLSALTRLFLSDNQITVING